MHKYLNKIVNSPWFKSIIAIGLLCGILIALTGCILFIYWLNTIHIALAIIVSFCAAIIFTRFFLFGDE
jgi:hypothetical protein